MNMNKIYMIYSLLKYKNVDVNIIGNISNYYGEETHVPTEEYFSTGFAWMWFDAEYHVVTYYGDIYYDTPVIIHRDVPVLNMGDGFMMMTDSTFQGLLDREIDYEEIGEQEEQEDIFII